MKWCVCELCLESGSWSWCPCASLDLNLNVREDLSYCFLCFIGCSLNFLDLCDFEQMGGEQVWGKMPVCLKFSWLISAFSRICQTEQVLALPAITVNKTPSCSLRSAHHSLNVSNICCPLHEAPTLQRPALWQPNYSEIVSRLTAPSPEISWKQLWQKTFCCGGINGLRNSLLDKTSPCG